MRIDGVLRTKGNEVISVAPQAILREAAELLHKHRIGALLVLDANHELVGIISERDIVGILAEQGSDALYARVDQAMSTEVVVCSPRDTVEQLMGVMTDRRIRHLPVVDDGQLVGVISIGDVVKRRLVEVCDEADALHGYLTSTR